MDAAGASSTDRGTQAGAVQHVVQADIAAWEASPDVTTVVAAASNRPFLVNLLRRHRHMLPR